MVHKPQGWHLDPDYLHHGLDFHSHCGGKLSLPLCSSVWVPVGWSPHPSELSLLTLGICVLTQLVCHRVSGDKKWESGASGWVFKLGYLLSVSPLLSMFDSLGFTFSFLPTPQRCQQLREITANSSQLPFALPVISLFMPISWNGYHSHVHLTDETAMDAETQETCQGSLLICTGARTWSQAGLHLPCPNNTNIFETRRLQVGIWALLHTRRSYSTCEPRFAHLSNGGCGEDWQRWFMPWPKFRSQCRVRR